MPKVISTKISVEEFDLLQRYARAYYTQNLLLQPNMSHMLRYILKGWVTRVREDERKTMNYRGKKKHPDPAAHYPMSVEYPQGL